jgi:hypothetical protein
MRQALAIALCAISLCAIGCSGSTGSGLVSFRARVGGPADAGPMLAFDSGMGYHITLARARFHLGAVYLNMSVPSSGGPEEPCILPGIYVGEVFGSCQPSGACGLDLDLLSPDLVPFDLPGNGTANPAVEAEVWLTAGDINRAADPTIIFDVAGVAARAGVEWPFAATITIGANRQLPVQNPAAPGTNPICRQRIVSPIPVALTLTDGGTLDVRVDPRAMFNGVDFTALAASGGSYVIPDQQGGVGGALFKGVTSTLPYQLTYSARP